MHVHLPKPLHGWREFVGEVGIIVLGILIALGAEQVVETLHWRSEVGEFRKAVDRELSLNLGTFEANEMQHQCIRRRLEELQAVLDHSGNGNVVHLVGRIGGPAGLSQYSSVWDNKNPDVVAHLPLEVQFKYAELYDEFRNTAQLKKTQSEVWNEFIPFEQPGPLSLDDQRKLHSLIVRARNIDHSMEANWPVSEKLGRALGLRAEFLPDNAKFMRDLPEFAICKAILPPAASAKTATD